MLDKKKILNTTDEDDMALPDLERIKRETHSIKWKIQHKESPMDKKVEYTDGAGKRTASHNK